MLNEITKLKADNNAAHKRTREVEVERDALRRKVEHLAGHLETNICREIKVRVDSQHRQVAFSMAKDKVPAYSVTHPSLLISKTSPRTNEHGYHVCEMRSTDRLGNGDNMCFVIEAVCAAIVVTPIAFCISTQPFRDPSPFGFLWFTMAVCLACESMSITVTRQHLPPY